MRSVSFFTRFRILKGGWVAMSVPPNVLDAIKRESKDEVFWLRLEGKRRSHKQNDLVNVLIRKLCEANGGKGVVAEQKMKRQMKEIYGYHDDNGKIKSTSLYSMAEMGDFITKLFAHCKEWAEDVDIRREEHEWKQQTKDA